MKALTITLSILLLVSPLSAQAKRHHGQSSGQSQSSNTQEKTSNCSNLPRRCADIQSCADAQRALHCGMTRLDRDNDGVACDKQCQ